MQSTIAIIRYAMDKINAEVARCRKEISDIKTQRRERLKNLDLFVLDNSISESTVGQIRSHTLRNKVRILEQVKKASIKDIIIASFSNMTRVDDDFARYLKAKGDDFTYYYSFSEVTQGIIDGRCNTETVPIGLRKNEGFGIPNTIFEVDLADDAIDWEGKFTKDDMCQLLYKWMKYVYDKISKNARIFVNLRDLPEAMATAPERLLHVVCFLSMLPAEHRPFGIIFEDPFGESLPEELEAWTASVRRTMADNGWTDGKFLVHIHQKWDLQTAAQLDCLNGGADGIWASLCEEGAALGHACSSVTIMNLIRLGNTKVLEKYNCLE